MRVYSYPLALISLCLVGGSPLYAQDVDIDALDEEDFADDMAEAQSIEAPTERQVAEDSEVLPEVVRGAYVQAILTDTLFLGSETFVDEAGFPYVGVGAVSGWGLGLKMAFGYELVESASFSAALELAYGQGAFNASGPSVFPESPVQGDFRTHTGQVSLKPTLILGKSRRLSLVGKVTGGVLYSPQIVSDDSLPPTGVHGTPHPFGGAGVGLEYYSKLAHFSVTLAEAEYLYVVGFDSAFALNFVGVKYTF